MASVDEDSSIYAYGEILDVPYQITNKVLYTENSEKYYVADFGIGTYMNPEKWSEGGSEFKNVK